ncbi:tyrosine-protein phosphatase [Candidatus Halocynthiibacter alkanivorans]|uniref:tyrosine-protein phosphatase n=1 Tax=Candidatus Halocynthiibacter alkanivorans TaxID=2267619 RepID=UPI000DF3BA6D|nr:tyrosine-protein phosphatase [Candidatus Halocynthiibacter alkanivorans]
MSQPEQTPSRPHFWFRKGDTLDTPFGRLRAHLHVSLKDHGILRALWSNLEEIAPGVWRSNHPSPKRLQRYRDMGIKTVLNLRGANGNAPYLLEREACERLGLPLVSQPINARALRPAADYLALLDLFETLPRPFVFHCKSGADRAGLTSAFYLLHMRGASIAEAKKMLNWRYVHLKFTRAGILDALLESYEADFAREALPLKQWLETRYDAGAITAEFTRQRNRPVARK